MHLQTTIQTAIKSLKQNKIRSLLTVSGVVIGVFAIVTLVSLVKGLQNYVDEQFESLGSNLIFIYPGSGGIANDPSLAFANNRLAEKHVKLIKREAKEVVSLVSPIIQTGGAASYKDRDYYASVLAGDAQLQDAFDLELRGGRHMTPFEARSGEKVALLGYKTKEELFGNIDPLGKEINVEGEHLKVIGYLPPKGQDYDQMVVMPLSLAEEIFDIKNYTYLAVKLKSKDQISIDAKQVELALLKDLDREDFTLYTQEDLLTQVQSILDILKFGLAAVAGISLLVGGIGIMNIMLVSVTERIREIGLRKALGATEAVIALQFLFESVILSISGGVIGLGFGFGGCLIARRWLESEVTPGMIGLSLGFSLLVGVLFGTYPALSASKKDPIESLRYE